MKLAASLLMSLFCCIMGNGQIDWQEYPYPLDNSLKDSLRFGYLTVPETKSGPVGKTLKIGFCILKSKAELPRKDAIIYLPGGPGQGYCHSAPFLLQMEPIRLLLQERDIVLFDPRGCGTSEPQLCYALEDPEIINGDLKGISFSEYWYGIAQAMATCRDSLIMQGFNPDAYGSSDIAADVEALRLALGYEKWNLRGHSYGTRYAQSVLRQYPDHVRSAIMSAVVPARWAYEDRDFYGFVSALRRLMDQCASDRKCNSAFPELYGQLKSLLQRIQQDPIILPPGTLEMLPASPIVINPKIMLQGLFLALYFREGYEMLPLMIHTAANGHDWIFDALAIALNIDFQIDTDMYHAIRCNDNPGYRYTPPGFSNDPLVAALYPYWQGDYDGTEADLCLNLGIPLDTTEQEMVQTDIPMLIFSGEFDPVTPPYYADSVAKYMPNATTFVVPGRGHDAPVPVSDLIAEFFITPEKPPDLSMIEELPGPQFLMDVHLNKGISAISVRMARGDYFPLAMVPAILALLIICSFLYFSYTLIRALVSRGKNGFITGALLPFFILTLIGTLFLVLLGFAFKASMSRHLYLLVFGLPEAWSFVLYVPWLLLLALVACMLSVKKLMRRSDKVLSLVFPAISWAASASLLIWLISWEII